MTQVTVIVSKSGLRETAYIQKTQEKIVEDIDAYIKKTGTGLAK